MEYIVLTRFESNMIVGISNANKSSVSELMPVEIQGGLFILNQIIFNDTDPTMKRIIKAIQTAGFEFTVREVSEDEFMPDPDA